MKTLNNSTVNQAQNQVGDLEVVGNGNMFQLLCKASSEKEKWMKSTKAMEIPGLGCVVQVTTQQGIQVAEAVTFVPGVCIAEDENGGRKLVPTLELKSRFPRTIGTFPDPIGEGKEIADGESHS